MDKEFSELVEYLDKKFDKLAVEASQLRGEVSTEISQLHEGVRDIKDKMTTKIEVNKLLDAVDAYMKQGEDYCQEMVMLSHKVDRYERAI